MLIYENLCPVCGGDLSFEEITQGVCLKTKKKICGELELEFESFFEKCVAPLRGIQRMWAKRVLSGDSFSLIAPTGIGKTSFGLSMALFLATKKKKSYIIFPTTLLVRQAISTLKSFANRLNLEVGFNEIKEISVGYYHTEVEKNDFVGNLKNFDIVITTSQYLAKNFEILKDLRFHFIFVDDVDSVLKSSKNVERILHVLARESGGTLVVSTATAKVGKKAELFRKFLNFSIGSSQYHLRNVEDIIANGLDLEVILKKLGKGGIIYAKSIEECEKLYEMLRHLKTGIVTSKDSKDFELFLSGELDYLIGTMHHYGALVRGIDLPEKIRFVIFTSCPVYRVRIEDIDKVPTSMLRIIAYLYKEDERIEKFIPKLKSVEKISEELREVLKEVMAEKEVSTRDAVVRKGEIIFPDVRTYLQASGRTSRLTVNGLTKGASFLFEKDEDVLKAFIERAKLFDINFKKFSEFDLEKLKKEIEESREVKKEIELIKPALFIVESPTKAKQIARFFGKPGIRFIDSIPVYEVPTENYLLMITSTLGHLTDLVTNRGFHGVEEGFVPIYTTIKRCKNCGNQFTEKICPKCRSEAYEDSNRIISTLRKVSQEAELVIVGTDPDAEGEKISWDLKCLLCKDIKRAEFHEVTKRAIVSALNNLKQPNLNLVKSQIIRRIEDRWIGFELSQKLQNYFGRRNLSAGRAQTPALGWIVERYRESRKKRTIAIIRDLDLVMELETKEKECEVKVELIEERKEKRMPLPPYTTNSLLFDANNILKMSAKETMQVAQDLFENGLITYHRTDSTRVSDFGLSIAKEFLQEHFYGREWFSEGAHECIRPTKALDKNSLERLIYEGIILVENFSWSHFALYDLIFRRFMASQCKDFEVTIKKFCISFDGKKFEEERIVKAEGKAYELFKSVWVRKDLELGIYKTKIEVKKVPMSSLLTQAELIRMMKERGIGRPSTYATIVEKLFSRGYIVEKNGRLIPTRDGIEVYEYLVLNYERFISEDRTRILEEKMDAVERGEINYLDALKELYEEIKMIR